jgi:hypothetical protein
MFAPVERYLIFYVGKVSSQIRELVAFVSVRTFPHTLAHWILQEVSYGSTGKASPVVIVIVSNAELAESIDSARCHFDSRERSKGR